MKKNVSAEDVRELLKKDIDEVVRFAYDESIDRDVALRTAFLLLKTDSSVPKMKILGFVQAVLSATRDSEVSKELAEKCRKFLYRLSLGASQEESQAINRIFCLLLVRVLDGGSRKKLKENETGVLADGTNPGSKILDEKSEALSPQVILEKLEKVGEKFALVTAEAVKLLRELREKNTEDKGPKGN